MNEMELFLISFSSGFAGAWGLSRFGRLIGMTDLPNERSSHNNEVCKGGGIGTLFALMLSAWLLDVEHFIWVPALVISVASLWGGDKYKLSVKQRLVIHFGCSLYFLWFFMEPIRAGVTFQLLFLPLAVFIVGTANFYNFMDGIDGIAGITGGVAFSLLAWYGSRVGADSVHIVFCLCMTAACLGFLCFNFPRAKVFLGDVGSILIGFIFACLTIFLAQDPIDFIIMAGFLFPFYLDEISTMVIRIKDRQSLVIAHRRHIYQLLVNELGQPHWFIALAYGIFQFIVAVSVIMLKSKGIVAVLLVYMVYIFAFLGISWIVRRKAA